MGISTFQNDSQELAKSKEGKKKNFISFFPSVFVHERQ